MHIQLFEEWRISFKPDKEKKKDADIDNYDPPEYLVQPHDGDTGYFLVKKEFDKIKTTFTPKIRQL